MLIRPDGDAAILITQPAHAWVSGQLARVWAGEGERPFEPFEEVCLAAEQHDIGWITWESTPTLNPETGLPHAFREMPRRTHVQIWSRARRYASIFGRYPALLVSLHGTGLFERFGPGEDAPQTERSLVEGFLSRERAAQQRLIESLGADARYANLVQPEVLEDLRRLISLWDGMSLAICGGVEGDRTTIGDYTLDPGEEEGQITVDPWPFAGEKVPVFVEARRLSGRHERQTGLQAAMSRAEHLVLEFDLEPVP